MNKKEKRQAIVQKTAAKLCRKVSLINYNGQYFRYMSGVYRHVETRWLHREIFIMLGSQASIHEVEQTEKKIGLAVYREQSSVDELAGILNLENGLLDLKTGELRPHSPDVISFNQLPVKYNPEADCPRFKQFLGEIFKDEPANADVVMEYNGYTLESHNGFEVTMAYLGGGANGKGTLARVMQGILGKDNYSCIPIERLGQRFELAFLINKMANFSSEVLREATINSARFKEIVSGDECRGEWKNGNVFFFKPRAKLFMLLNHLPRFGESGYSIKRRLLIVPFNQRFPKEMADKKLVDKLLEEKSGILNLILTARERLLARGYFEPTPMMEKILEEALEINNSVASFVKNECLLKPGAQISVDNLHGAYQNFCKNNARYRGDVHAKIEFGKALRSHLGRKVSRGRKSTERVWKGITLHEDKI